MLRAFVDASARAIRSVAADDYRSSSAAAQVSRKPAMPRERRARAMPPRRSLPCIFGENHLKARDYAMTSSMRYGFGSTDAGPR